MSSDKRELDRRQFLKESTAAAAAFSAVLRTRSARGEPAKGDPMKRVIVLGFDGMDPRLTEQMMDAGDLPNLNRLRQADGYRRLATTIPPQTPVAFASFITGLNPGGHGIFDFIHRDPAEQGTPYFPMFSAAGTSRGSGYWEIGDHKLQLPFWPFGHEAAQPVLYRQGVPFWDYLDAAGVPTHIYEMPSNYPPSESQHGCHRALAGLGTPDMQGTYGTYQYFAENVLFNKEMGGGIHSPIFFKKDSAQARLTGPMNTFLKEPEPTTVEFAVHRDRDAALIEIQGQRILLAKGQWSKWVRLDFRFAMPSFVPDEYQSGICRFYLQELTPYFRLYVTPINIDPAKPAIPISEPPKFITDIADELGMFYTAGFQEDHKALTNKVFTDDEYIAQTDLVLEERMEMLEYALHHYGAGMLFFYFACTDLQPHMFFWDSDETHPIRSPEDARKYHGHVKDLYQKMDKIVGDMLERFGDSATLLAMSDHGMVHFKRQFNLCSWLRDNGYIQPSDCESLLVDVDWSRTQAYGLGLNGLYLNLKGRERDGIVDADQRETLLTELIEKLEAVRDVDGREVIRKVYRGDEVYSGEAMKLAPDLIVGYHRGFRCSWETTLGNMADEVLSDNTEAWSADHCLAAEDVPGILFSNKPIKAKAPSLLDLAPTILAEYGVAKPAAMVGNNLFGQI